MTSKTTEGRQKRRCSTSHMSLRSRRNPLEGFNYGRPTKGGLRTT